MPIEESADRSLVDYFKCVRKIDINDANYFDRKLVERDLCMAKKKVTRLAEHCSQVESIAKENIDGWEKMLNTLCSAHDHCNSICASASSSNTVSNSGDLRMDVARISEFVETDINFSYDWFNHVPMSVVADGCEGTYCF